MVSNRQMKMPVIITKNSVKLLSRLPIQIIQWRLLINWLFTVLLLSISSQIHAQSFLDTTFNQNVDGRVNAIAMQANQKILIGDGFNIVSGQSRNGIARMDVNSCESTPINFGQTINGSLSSTDCITSSGEYYDDYTFSGTAGQKVIVSMNSNAFDTFLELYNSAGILIFKDADSGGRRNSVLIFSLTASGTYRIRARSFSTNRVGNYTITLTNNNNCPEPTPTNFGQTINGTLSSTDCIGSTTSFGSGHYYDDYTFSGTAGQNITISVDSTALDTYLELYNSNGNLISNNSFFVGARTNPLQLSLPTSGTYRIRARSYSFTATGAYTVTLTNDGICSLEPTAINLAQIINGVLSASDCSRSTGHYYDDYTFNGTAGQKIAVAMNSTSFDTLLELYNPDGNLVYTNDDGGDGTNSLLVYSLRASGVYRIRARSFIANQTGAYTITLTNAGICDPLPCFHRVSGEIFTADGRVLDDVLISINDGLRTYYPSETDGYSISLERDQDHTIIPKFSTHSFSPSAYTFNPLTKSETGKDFIATLINDNFASAVQLSGDFGQVEGNNREATREIGEPLHAGVVGGTSVWYRWRASRDGQFTFTTEGSKFDTLLAVYQGTSVGNLSQVAANDNMPTATSSRVTFTAQANTDYYIAVDGRAGLAGSGYFRMVYSPVDSIPGFIVSGRSLVEVRGIGGEAVVTAVVTAEDLIGNIIARSVVNQIVENRVTGNIFYNFGEYSIVIPQGITSFKLSVSNQSAYKPKIFTNITQNQTYDFFDGVTVGRSCSDCVNVIGFVIPTLFGLNNINDLTVTVSGTNITGSVQCPVSVNSAGDIRYTCAGLLPFGTYTVTPNHPAHRFSPASRTFTSGVNNITGLSFGVEDAPGFRISGKITQGDNPLNGVSLCVLLATDSFCSYTIETDANGNYSTSPLPAGKNYVITPSLPGFNLQPLTATSFTNLQSDQTVNFSATSNCAFSLSALQQIVPAAGGFYSFNISANAGCESRTKTTSAGITIISPLTYGSGTISYFVQANSGAARTGAITVAGQTFTVSQEAGKSRKRTRFFQQ